MTTTDYQPILPDTDDTSRHMLSVPPRDMLPAAVHPAYDEWTERLATWGELDAQRATAQSQLADADRKDRQLHVDAVKAGSDLAAIGTPRRDAALDEQRSLVHQEQAARQVAQEARTRLYRALLDASDDELARLAAQIDQAAAAYLDTISAAMQARRSYRWLRDRRHYWETIGERGGPRWPAPIGAGVDANHTDLAQAVLALRNAGMTDTQGLEY